MSFEVVYNQSDFDYRRAEGVNQSSLKKILISPAHYQAALKDKLIPTPAMEIGTALHCLALDGSKAFESQYVLQPDDIKLNTKAGKEWKEAQGRKKVFRDDGKDKAWSSIHGMAENLRQIAYFDPTQADYIKHNEASIYWDWDGVPCKARLDRIDIERSLVLDLKTTDSIEVELFTKKVVGLGYDFQAYFYKKAAEIAFGKAFKFIFAAIERKAPYSADLFEVDDEMEEEGRRKCEAAIQAYKRCQETKEWPNRPAMVRKLSYPSWYVPYDNMEEPREDIF